MKRPLFLIGLTVATLWICGCRQFADSVVNQTGHPVRLKVTFANPGGINDHLKLPGTNDAMYGFVFEKPGTIEFIEAFTLDNKKIGEFSRNDIPFNSKEYENNISYAIFDDGVFPVGRSCNFIGSPPQYSEEQVKNVFKKETAKQ